MLLDIYFTETVIVTGSLKYAISPKWAQNYVPKKNYFPEANYTNY